MANRSSEALSGELRLFVGQVILPDSVLAQGAVLTRGVQIEAVGRRNSFGPLPASLSTIEAPAGGYIAPGYVDLHVHGGWGADFMDGTLPAFSKALRSHAAHGTTSILPTSTAASHGRILSMLDLCRQTLGRGVENGPRVLGAHLYGPYFAEAARGCHPGPPIHAPQANEYDEYLERSEAIVTASVAPEMAGAREFTRACLEHGIRVNAGHSHATAVQMADAVGWGVRHVDHLFCAMSDKAKLRTLQPYPMRGGVLEATLYHDELTTEVIADGKHLSPDLLLLAWKLKGPDRLALVTDCNRALDMPEGRYQFGPLDEGTPFDHLDGVGLMPGGASLASSVRGMDHMVRTFHSLTGRPVFEVVRMASLTPARIAGWVDRIGSLAPGKFADLLLLDKDLNVRAIYIDGERVAPRQDPR